jgi:hypothetical protein
VRRPLARADDAPRAGGARWWRRPEECCEPPGVGRPVSMRSLVSAEVDRGADDALTNRAARAGRSPRRGRAISGVRRRTGRALSPRQFRPDGEPGAGRVARVVARQSRRKEGRLGISQSPFAYLCVTSASSRPLRSSSWIEPRSQRRRPLVLAPLTRGERPCGGLERIRRIERPLGGHSAEGGTTTCADSVDGAESLPHFTTPIAAEESTLELRDWLVCSRQSPSTGPTRGVTPFTEPFAASVASPSGFPCRERGSRRRARFARRAGSSLSDVAERSRRRVP